MVDIVFRSTAPEDLTAAQIDANFRNLKEALENLIANPPSPVEVSSITSSGSKMTFNMSDGKVIGPVYMPILSFHWREDWQANTVYKELDVFRVAGVGLYMVQINHTSATTFDKNAVDSNSNNLYLELFVFAAAENIVYDMGFSYPGVLKDIPNSYGRIWEELIIRKVLLPKTPAAGSFHRVKIRVAPTTNGQTFVLYQNDTAIGSAFVPIGSNTGTVTITADTTLTANVDSIGLGRQAADDAVAAGLSLMLAAQQVVG